MAYRVKYKANDDTTMEPTPTTKKDLQPFIAEWYGKNDKYEIYKVEKLRYQDPLNDETFSYHYVIDVDVPLVYPRVEFDFEVIVDLRGMTIVKNDSSHFAEFNNDELKFFDKLDFEIIPEHYNKIGQTIHDWWKD